MKLRPRYSLLTLLVLTALVAGGVKLWYGPHRAMMSDPPTAMEQELLARATWVGLFQTHCQFEYIYRNSWNGPEFLALIPLLRTPRDTADFYIEVRPNNERTFLLATWHDPTEPIFHLREEFRKTKDLCTIYTGKSLREPPVKMEKIDGVPVHKDCYILTADGKIYQLIAAWIHSRVNEVELSEVADPIAREMLEMMLSELSLQKN